MDEKEFKIRLAKLRTQKSVSAREMSSAIGQNPSYINNIETGKALPSMTGFFYICDYFNITPQEFFDTDSEAPAKLRELTNKLKKLTPKKLEHLSALVDDILK